MITGKLDQKISIEAVTMVPDGMGSESPEWSAISGAPEWAQYIPLRGTDQILAGQLSEKEQFKLRIYWSSLVNRTCRVSYNSKNYEIVDIEDGKRSGYMVLFCREAS